MWSKTTLFLNIFVCDVLKCLSWYDQKSQTTRQKFSVNYYRTICLVDKSIHPRIIFPPVVAPDV